MSEVSQIEIIKQRLKTHDHFFEWSDDLRVFKSGLWDMVEIKKMMLDAGVKFEDVIDLIPEETRKHWGVVLNR